MRIRNRQRNVTCERLEDRLMLSGSTLNSGADVNSFGDAPFNPVIVAGSSNGSPADSASNRVDPNSATSPFAGVGSLQISTNSGTYICTGTAIDATHVLTAGHCVDFNDDGRSDSRDGIRSITFNLNLDFDSGGDKVDVRIGASSWQTHPDFTGFSRPSVNDDLAVITLSGTGVPANVPKYGLATSNMVAPSTHLYLVGYGRSGDGVNGYTTSASYTVKRRGENMADAFYGQDDSGRASANEVFRFDFDGPSGSGIFGGPTLGNNKETTLGGGDSGGPSFVLCSGCDPKLASSYKIAGVNTFTQGFNTPRFGSQGGGINVYPYTSWILGPHGTSGTTGGASKTGGARAAAGSGAGALPGDSPHGDVQDNNLTIIVALPESTWRPITIQPTNTPELTSNASDGSVISARTVYYEPDATRAPLIMISHATVTGVGRRSTTDEGVVSTIDAVLQDWPSVV